MRSGRHGRTVCRAIAGPVALVLLAGTAVAAPADTRAKISSAKQRLAALEAQIASEQAHVQAMQASMRTLAARVAGSRRAYDAIQAEIAQTRLQRAGVEARYRAIRAEIDVAAADAYKRGPGYTLEALMQQSSLSDAAYVLGYTTAIARHNAELGDQARLAAADLDRKARQESALRSQRRAALAGLTSQQNALTRLFIEEQARLASLAAARAQAGTLLVRLRKQLAAEELAAALQALSNGTPMSFGRWAAAFLGRIGAPVARNNLVVMVAWETAEYTAARWNPLATTYPMTGSTMFNSSRVRNYLSLSQGLDATIATLRAPGYGYDAILAGLARNADPMTTAQAINASRWCSGCTNGRYVIYIVPVVEQYFDRYANARAGA
jgi:hypothetical protein